MFGSALQFNNDIGFSLANLHLQTLYADGFNRNKSEKMPFHKINNLVFFLSVKPVVKSPKNI